MPSAAAPPPAPPSPFMPPPRAAEPRRAAPRAAEPRHAAPRPAEPRHAAPRAAEPRHAAPADQGEELVLLGGDLVGEQELADVGGAQEIDRVYLRGVGQAERLRHLLGRLQRILPFAPLEPLHLRLRAVVPGEERAVGPAEVVHRVELVALVAETRVLVGPRALEPHEERGAVLLARARPALVRGAEDDVAALDAADAALAGRALRAVDLEPVGGQRLCRGVTRERRVLRFALRPDDRAVGGALVGRRGRLGRIRHFQGGFKGFFGLRRDLRRLGFGVDVDVIRLRGRSGRHGVRQPRKRPIRCTHAVAR